MITPQLRCLGLGVAIAACLASPAFGQAPVVEPAEATPGEPLETPAPGVEPAEATPAVESTAAPPELPTGSDEVIEVVDTTWADEPTRMRRSAEAVNVVDTRQARQRSADLGEVLARAQGVAVRRDGGLGSSARFTLDGLSGNQIRLFLDGVPLDLAGYPFGIENVPVNLIDRVELYRGVVPIRFGADALGGAVNLATDASFRPRLAASYQVGSFGTHRLTLDGRYQHQPTGLVIGATAFLDRAINDYQVDVEEPDLRGRPLPVTVSRFHDRYRAPGGTLTAGVVERPWARRLLVQLFASSYDKDLQHDPRMETPYGDARYGEAVVGATGRYDVALGARAGLELVTSYARRTIDFVDTGDGIYNWFGERFADRRMAGETRGKPLDQVFWQHGVFGRALARWQVAPSHVLRISASPTFTTRTGDERAQLDPGDRDPLTAQRDQFTLVGGLEYELTALDGRLANIALVKGYAYQAQSDEPVPSGAVIAHDVTSRSLGAGDSLRFRVAPWLYLKTSYEYATRLPRPDEVFGNAVLILASLDLQPEVSHNANLGTYIELRRTSFGDLTIEANAFLRLTDRQIVLLSNDRTQAYQNVSKSRGLGVDAAAAWASPGETIQLDGALTLQDVRNVAEDGPFRDLRGDRIPNLPYLFGSWGARFRLVDLLGMGGILEPFYTGRYVHAFYRGWESLGLRDFKPRIATQLTHTVGATWSARSERGQVSATFEVQNAGNAAVFDFYGVQKPGRAVFVKLTADM